MGAYNYRNNIVFFFNFISYQPQKIANFFGYICISFAFQIVFKKKLGIVEEFIIEPYNVNISGVFSGP